MSYIGNTQQNQNYFPAVDFFSGNGSTTAFTLSRPVASTAAIQVIVSNVAQNPSDAYTVNGNTITFTSAPPSGTNNIYVYYTSPNTTVVQPSQGTVYPSSLSTGGPTWDTAGNLTLNNGAADGAQLVLKSAGYSDWNLDNYSGRLRAYYGGTEYFTINSSGNVGIGTSSPDSNHKLEVAASGTVEIGLRSGNTSEAILNFGRAADRLRGRIAYNNSSEYMAFWTNQGEKMRIDSSGNLLVGTTSIIDNTKFNFSFTSATNGIGTLTDTTATSYHMRFKNPNGVVGGVYTNGSNTTYTTSSDYRLKENIQPMTGALDVVQRLNPVTFNWKVDGSDGQGFIAHELQAVVPDCVGGEKDAVDEEGNPVYQGIDTSFLVATLTKAIQELSAKNDALEARIASLEAK